MADDEKMPVNRPEEPALDDDELDGVAGGTTCAPSGIYEVSSPGS